MTQRSIVVLAVVMVIGLTVTDAFVVYGLQDPTRYVAHAILRSLALGIAALAAAWTASRYRWASEYVGRAWTLLFTLYAFLTVSYVLNRIHMSTPVLADIMTIVGNLAAIGAFWLFGRALRTAGLQFYGPAWVKIAVLAAAVAVACVLVVPTLIDVWNSDAGPLSRTADFVSSAADMATFMLVAPLLLTLWSFRGGRLSWVYGCLALSTIGWMINSAADNMLPEVAVRDAQMTGLFLACMAVAAAAYSQIATTRMGGTANV